MRFSDTVGGATPRRGFGASRPLHVRGLLLAVGTTLAALTALPASAQGVPAGGPVVEEMLARPARDLDELRVRPGTDFRAYREVLVEPARASMRKNWRKDINDSRSPARWVSTDDEKAITDEAAASLRTMTQAGFELRGFRSTDRPGPGVLRLVPSVTELDVYAPDTETPGIERYYVRDGGQATLHLDVFDAVSGLPLARITDRSTARELRLINRAVGASNVFWFEALFRDWAGRSAAALLALGPPT